MDSKSTFNRPPYERMMPEETRQHLRAAREEFWKSFEGMIPRGFVEHRRKARREMLLAWRSMIDSRLSHLDEDEMGDIARDKGMHPDVNKPTME